MSLIAAIIVWSVETCSDKFAAQLFRTHLSGCYHIFHARVTILQLQNNSSEVVKINLVSSPSAWSLHGRISLRDARPELPWVHFNSCLMLALLYCPAQEMIRVVSWQCGVRKGWVFAWVNSTEILPVLAPQGSSEPSRAKMGFLMSNCCWFSFQ